MFSNLFGNSFRADGNSEFGRNLSEFCCYPVAISNLPRISKSKCIDPAASHWIAMVISARSLPSLSVLSCANMATEDGEPSRMLWAFSGTQTGQEARTKNQTSRSCPKHLHDNVPTKTDALNLLFGMTVLVFLNLPQVRNVPVTPTPSICPKVLPYKCGAYCRKWEAYCMQYKWEAYCRVSLSSKLKSQESMAIQMGGVLPYKLEVYCRTF